MSYYETEGKVRRGKRGEGKAPSPRPSISRRGNAVINRSSEKYSHMPLDLTSTCLADSSCTL